MLSYVPYSWGVKTRMRDDSADSLHHGLSHVAVLHSDIPQSNSSVEVGLLHVVSFIRSSPASQAKKKKIHVICYAFHCWVVPLCCGE